MIQIDKTNEGNTYVCPYCGLQQVFTTENDDVCHTGYSKTLTKSMRSKYSVADYSVHSIKCANKICGKISVVALHSDYNEVLKEGRSWLGVPVLPQIDILPSYTFINFPSYVPEQIRTDYAEGVGIIEMSPKAAATLFRRCLQGMIRDYWEIDVSSKKLYDEIDAIKDKVTKPEWRAIDAVRKLGNIGAHMEQDVNIIIDIEPNEAQKLQKLIELLIEKWYIGSHDAEMLLCEISEMSDEKEKVRNETRD